MAIKADLKWRSHGVTWKSGHVYQIGHYQGWENDPSPTLIVMYRLSGINPSTGHQWRFIQGINMTYIPRAIRKQFAQHWARELERTNGNIEFTWDLVQNRYPYLEKAVRRYFYKPSYYIKNVKAIPFDEMESVIVSTWSKDFSKKVRVTLAQKYRAVMGRNKRGFFSLFKR